MTDEHGHPEGSTLPLTTEHAGRRRRKRRTAAGCLIPLILLALLAGAAYWGISKGIDEINSRFGDPDDFAGPGTGQVNFEVAQGDSVAQMGRNLKDEGVVASVEAFTDAAGANPDATGIQAGFFALQKEMRASDVVEILVDPANLVTSNITVPEGLRVVDIVDILVENTDFPRRQFIRLLENPGPLGLPESADGNPEGYLFPATYSFGPNAKPRDMLKAMVDRWRQAADKADLAGAAERLGYTEHELMTIASLIEAEGRGDDMPKISRVIYNRVENPNNGITNGLLQIDAAVNYALGEKGIAKLTTDQINSVPDSPYNTYKQPGLPPGPIEAPGDDAIAAAANPVDGNWLFYVTVNLETGETKFTPSYDEFLEFKSEFTAYCANESDRC